MIYLYTLLGINFSYPDIKNILYSSYLNGKKIKNKNIDYTDFFINEILCDENMKTVLSKVSIVNDIEEILR